METRTIHALMIAELALANIPRYPYLDRATGAKRYVVVKADPKAATIKAPSKKQQSAKAERAAEKRGEKKAADEAARVEVRKIDGDKARAEIRKPAPAADVSDPFAATRERMEQR